MASDGPEGEASDGAWSRRGDGVVARDVSERQGRPWGRFRGQVWGFRGNEGVGAWVGSIGMGWRGARGATDPQRGCGGTRWRLVGPAVGVLP